MGRNLTSSFFLPYGVFLTHPAHGWGTNTDNVFSCFYEREEEGKPHMTHVSYMRLFTLVASLFLISYHHLIIPSISYLEYMTSSGSFECS
jgi:hypothetical protein